MACVLGKLSLNAGKSSDSDKKLDIPPLTEQMHIDFLLLKISFSVVMYRKYAFISDHRPGLEAKSIWNIPRRLPSTMCNVSVSKLNPDVSNGVL